MIVRPDGTDLLLFLQSDHARLAGDLAAAWGNAQFAAPQPRGPLLVAAALHDEGWAEWDAAPELNPATGRPYQFYDVPFQVRADFYRRGVDLVARENAYVGMLVSMHMAALWAGYGVRPPLDLAALAPPDRAAVAQFLRLESSRQAALRAGLSPGGSERLPTLEFDRQMLVNFRLLTAWDALSLYLCLRDPAAGEADVIQHVPVNYAGDESALTLRGAGPGAVMLAPWPFVAGDLRVSVPAYRVPDRPYSSREEFLEAYRGASREPREFAIMAAR